MLLKMPDAEVSYHADLFTQAESDDLLNALQHNIDWRQDQIKMYGKVIPLPRLTAWYGDSGKSYTYSGITMEALAWTPELLTIKHRIEPIAGVEFNSVLLNYYRSGNDSMAWHADDEPELGRNPIIGSVSFGAARFFHFKHKSLPQEKRKFELQHGSFLLMGGTTQHFWLHQIPKTTKPIAPRINLTFRVIR